MKACKAEIIFTFALVCGLFAGCGKEGITEKGGVVSFNVTSGSIDTRTEYSGDGTYSSGQLTQERINWKLGDIFTAWSDNALHINTSKEDRHTADYIVQIINPVSAGDLTCRAIVDPVDHNGLQWGDGTGKFNFFAAYPAANVSFSGTTTSDMAMSATIPASQSMVSWTTDSDGVQVGTPDMQYGFMFASATNLNNADAVTLNFNPMFTAFEFTIDSGVNDKVYVKSFQLETTTSDGKLAGTFVLNSSAAVASTSSTSKTITVSLLDTGSNPKEVTVANPLRFTVFALPMDQTDLRIKFLDGDDTTFTLKLNYSEDASANAGEPILFGAKKKHRIYGLHFPSLLDAAGEYILWDQEIAGENLIWDN